MKKSYVDQFLSASHFVVAGVFEKDADVDVNSPKVVQLIFTNFYEKC